MKSTYKNSIRSRELIMDAVMKLLLQKRDLNAITVTDITRVTGLNRGTFYNHYNNVAEVLEDCEKRMVDELTKEWILIHNQSDGIPAFFKKLKEHIINHQEHLKIYVDCIPGYFVIDLKERLLKIVKEYYVKDYPEYPETDYNMRIFVNGVMMTAFDYLRGKNNIDMDKFEATCVKLLLGFLPDRLNKN